jgi:hypothetical protein
MFSHGSDKMIIAYYGVHRHVFHQTDKLTSAATLWRELTGHEMGESGYRAFCAHEVINISITLAGMCSSGWFGDIMTLA